MTRPDMLMAMVKPPVEISDYIEVNNGQGPLVPGIVANLAPGPGSPPEYYWATVIVEPAI